MSKLGILRGSKLGIPIGYRRARRQIIVGIFGILVLLTEAGFTLLASAILTTPAPGSLATDSTKLCPEALSIVSVARTVISRKTRLRAYIAYLCPAATSTMPPVNSDSFPRIKESSVPATTHHAHRHSVIMSIKPDAARLSVTSSP